MNNLVVMREAKKSDHEFIFKLSPHLAEVAQLSWHSDKTVQKMQDDYITEMLSESSQPSITLIAEREKIPLGFIHVRTHKDSISGETCGTIPLLAVAPKSQGMGVGKLLVAHGENWAKNINCRLLHLEVFSNNTKAKDFYLKMGFKPEVVHMIKTL